MHDAIVISARHEVSNYGQPDVHEKSKLDVVWGWTLRNVQNRVPANQLEINIQIMTTNEVIRSFIPSILATTQVYDMGNPDNSSNGSYISRIWGSVIGELLPHYQGVGRHRGVHFASHKSFMAAHLWHR